jgi:hypothetical protein
MKKADFSIYPATDRHFLISKDIFQKVGDTQQILIFNYTDESLYEIYGNAIHCWKLLNEGLSLNHIILELAFQFDLDVDLIFQKIDAFLKDLIDLKIISEKTNGR